MFKYDEFRPRTSNIISENAPQMVKILIQSIFGQKFFRLFFRTNFFIEA